MRSWGGAVSPLAKKPSPASRCSARARPLQNPTWCCRSGTTYLEDPLQGTDVAALAQGRLHGVDDHVGHARPGALRDLSCLRVGDQRVADGFREQLRISKDENPAWGGKMGKKREMR